MCQCGLPVVLWSHIGILMRRLVAEPRSTAGLLFHSQYPSGTILLTLYAMVSDWRVSRAKPMFFFIGLSCSILTIVFTIFPFLFFLFIDWYCGAGVFGLIVCISLSLSVSLPTSFYNNYNNNNKKQFVIIMNAVLSPELAWDTGINAVLSPELAWDTGIECCRAIGAELNWDTYRTWRQGNPNVACF